MKLSLLAFVFLAFLPKTEAFLGDLLRFFTAIVCSIPLLSPSPYCGDPPTTPSLTTSPTLPPTPAPTDVPSASPTNSPTGNPPNPCDPNPCGVNAICVAETTNFACVCMDGFDGDPIVQCSAVPEVSIRDFDPTTFNRNGGPLCYTITSGSFNTDVSTVQVSVNGAVVPEDQLSVMASEICATVSFEEDAQNDCSLQAQEATSGIAITLGESLWVGSSAVGVTIVDDTGAAFFGEVTVTARLADDASVASVQIGNTGSFSFENLPSRTIIFTALTTDGQSGSAGAVAGAETTASISLMGFLPPSEIDNNDFSKGLEGWNNDMAASANIVAHVENVGPTTGRRTLQRELEDQDFELSTCCIEGPSTTSRTFETKEGTTGVRVRYRFVTSEFPTYFGTQYNDYFAVSIRSQGLGGSTTEANSMNGLGSGAFDSSGSTSWREAVLPVQAGGDTIQVDVTVANVGDGAVQSFVYIDFVEELQQSLCIYSSAAPTSNLTDGHAAIVYYNGLDDSSTTYGLWPDGHEDVLANGDSSDIRTDLSNDNPSLYTYFYCKPINDKEKGRLDSLVAANVQWTCTNTCASFASETFFEVTGTDVDADDIFGVETPREISKSIVALNSGSPIPPEGLPFANGNRALQTSSPDSSFLTDFLSDCGYL